MSVIDQIFTLRVLQAESYKHRIEIFLAFVDFKQGMDKQAERVGINKARDTKMVIIPESVYSFTEKNLT